MLLCLLALNHSAVMMINGKLQIYDESETTHNHTCTIDGTVDKAYVIVAS